MGIRPLAISWPPERRAADANGAAHRFSQMSTPAVLPGSMAAARCSTSSAANSSASCASTACSSPSSLDVGELRRLDGAVLVLGEDQDVDHADRSGVDQREQLCGHLAGEVARSRWELDDEVVDGAELIERCCLSSLFSFAWPVWAPFRYWRAIATRRRSSGVIRWSASSASSPRSICTQLTVPVKTLLSPS